MPNTSLLVAFFYNTVQLIICMLFSTVIASITQARAEDSKAINENSFYPEQPFWYMGNLYYTEMSMDRVMRWDGKKNDVVWSRPGCGPTSVAGWAGNTLIILCHQEHSLVKIDLSGRTVRLINRDSRGLPFVHPNGSTNDGKGGLYFSASGLFAPNAPTIGAVYHLKPDETIHRVADKIWYSNGVALSHDGLRLFVSEHLGRHVLVYQVKHDNTLSDRKLFVDLNRFTPPLETREWDVGPDGLLMDAHDNLYICEYGAGRLLIVNKDGSLLSTIHFPERYVTAARFGATEERIFVTAPSNNTHPPFVGKVYSVDNPVYEKSK